MADFVDLGRLEQGGARRRRNQRRWIRFGKLTTRCGQSWSRFCWNTGRASRQAENRSIGGCASMGSSIRCAPVARGTSSRSNLATIRVWTAGSVVGAVTASWNGFVQSSSNIATSWATSSGSGRRPTPDWARRSARRDDGPGQLARCGLP